jgi:hypothetical protein
MPRTATSLPDGSHRLDGRRSLRKFLVSCAMVLATAASVIALQLPASAATARPATATTAVTAPAGASAAVLSGLARIAGATPPPVITIGGHSYPTAPLLGTQRYVVMDPTTGVITVLPGAQAALTASTYSELTGLVSALNAGDTALRASVARAPVPASASASARPIPRASACTNRFHYTWGQPLNLYIPDCMAYGFTAVVGGPAAVAAFLFSEIGPLEWTAALIIASAIVAANALLISWAGFCDIFGPGNGVRFTWTWTQGVGTGPGYPTFGCW